MAFPIALALLLGLVNSPTIAEQTDWCVVDDATTRTHFVCFDTSATYVCLLYYDERYDLCVIGSGSHGNPGSGA